MHQPQAIHQAIGGAIGLRSVRICRAVVSHPGLGQEGERVSLSPDPE